MFWSYWIGQPQEMTSSIGESVDIYFLLVAGVESLRLFLSCFSTGHRINITSLVTRAGRCVLIAHF